MRARGHLSAWKASRTVIVVGLVAVALAGLRIASDRPTPSPAGPFRVVVSTLPAEALGPAPRTSLPTGGASSGAEPSARPTAPRPGAASASGHVWWIIMENKEYGTIIGNPAASYFNRLAARYGLATRYYATSHPSEPNYMALVAGSTLGVTSDGVYHLARPSLFKQLADAGRSWRVYAQDVPGRCFTGTVARGGRDGPGAAGTYARKHNPAITFRSVSDVPAQCRNIQPLGAFDPGAAAFEMVVPNLINDMHDGSIRQGDAFLRAFVPQITGSAAFRAGGVLFITFDEGTSSRGAQGDRGGHVATLMISAKVTRGYRYRAYADHWSLLRTTERILGLPCLANACGHSPLLH